MLTIGKVVVKNKDFALRSVVCFAVTCDKRKT